MISLYLLGDAWHSPDSDSRSLAFPWSSIASYVGSVPMHFPHRLASSSVVQSYSVGT